MGKINPTVHAYISGEIVMTPHCARMQMTPNGTQQQKSVNTFANILTDIRISLSRSSASILRFAKTNTCI